MLHDNVLPDTLHGEINFSVNIFDQVDFTEGSLSNHPDDLEVLETVVLGATLLGVKSLSSLVLGHHGGGHWFIITLDNAGLPPHSFLLVINIG